VVVTGGPGVGKTTIVRAVVELANRMRRRCALAAPTGRAAKRLAESTGREAVTLHRLLEYNPQTGAFQRDADTPLEADLVVVDECSMVDLALFRALVVALPPRTQLVLVGDVDQLPSVGAGAVLSDVIASGAATVVRLTEIFRQAAQSKIVTSAHLINHGEVPDLESKPDAGVTSDFYFVGRDEAVAARDTVVEMVADRIPARFGFDRMTGVQVLAPMHRGELGTTALNAALQARLNPPGEDKPELSRGERAFRLGDKVMQLKNDYDRNVYNGDIGIVERVDPDAGKLWVALGDGRAAEYERADLDQLVLAYAVGPQEPGLRVPGGRHPARHPALHDAGPVAALHRGHPRQAAGGDRRLPPGGGHGGSQRHCPGSLHLAGGADPRGDHGGARVRPRVRGRPGRHRPLSRLNPLLIGDPATQLVPGGLGSAA
jgi:exodeoxyribonuclease V alpha subunit